MNNWTHDKKQVLDRLKRIEGQVRGVIGLIESETDDCERVVQQFAAVRKAMDRAFFDLMACVTKRELEAAGFNPAKAAGRLDKVTALLSRYG
jgi:CsoR family transcriptional regulator, copper-sensing transcriptional repressor